MAEELRDSWPNAVRSDAMTLLNSITDFEFLAVFAIVYSLLTPLQGITSKLQGRSNDICNAFSMVSRLNILEVNAMQQVISYCYFIYFK